MPFRFLLCKLIFGFGFLCFSFVSIGLSATSSAVYERDVVLKMQHPYPQPDEYLYLPGFCRVKLDEMRVNHGVIPMPRDLPRQREVWVNKMGLAAYTWSHHFCAGMNRIERFERSLTMGFGSRYKLTNNQKGTLEYALGEFGMIEPPYLQANTPLYVESVKLHAKTLHLLGRTAEAIGKIKEGIAARPTSATLYLYYAEILLESGNKAQAKMVLELGYKRTHGSKKISTMLDGLK